MELSQCYSIAYYYNCAVLTGWSTVLGFDLA